ncbi:VOC family protein [Microbacterium invictum]|uniref:Catechol 2,3-dioxygenase-like lactoylglutathione lyase family enzyme n=1 Tax=Microbacterium invictum TaxID=515415 RepID=A0AA40VMI2_9MICO|nr:MULTISPECIES: VOC family protein [Microbacterium]MBB4140476.1 catechol 2,3-dioxygenase-like lactoylglutathione lyase family enzyme [Microbacterium invictum]
MSIERIESVVYGVDDLDECARFFVDFGLELVEHTEDRVVLTTQVKQRLVLKRNDDPTLPASVEATPGIREVVWGVDSQAALDALVENLRTDREVDVDQDGVAHTYDETGFGLGLALTDPVQLNYDPRKYNSSGRVERWNQPHTEITDITPIRICHVALNIPKEGRHEAVDFYLNRLNFRATDIVEPMGVFMQVEGDDDQHNFLLCHRPDRAGTNHTSYEVSGFDDVIEGGNHMIQKGWREARRLGRHTVGSNVFRFIHNPAGGRVEYAADMDRVDDTYGPNVHAETPPHHIWVLETNRDTPAPNTSEGTALP